MNEFTNDTEFVIRKLLCFFYFIVVQIDTIIATQKCLFYFLPNERLFSAHYTSVYTDWTDHLRNVLDRHNFWGKPNCISKKTILMFYYLDFYRSQTNSTWHWVGITYLGQRLMWELYPWSAMFTSSWYLDGHYYVSWTGLRDWNFVRNKGNEMFKKRLIGRILWSRFQVRPRVTQI